MSIENLLTPLSLAKKAYRSIDKAILKHYTKKVMKTEADGKSRFDMILYEKIKMVPAAIIMGATGNIECLANNFYAPSLGLLSIMLEGTQLATLEKEDELEIDKSNAKLPVPQESAKNFLQDYRLGIMAAGLFNMGWAAYDYISGLFGNHADNNFMVYKASQGYQLYQLAKAIYMQSADPKVLEKELSINHDLKPITIKINNS